MSLVPLELAEVNKKFPLGEPFFVRLVLISVGCIAMFILLAIVTGNFAPWHTSELDRVGICVAEEDSNIVKAVDIDTQTLYICGYLVGETKRDIGFDLFYESNGAFSKTYSLRPGEFHIPIDASRLLFLDAETYPPGSYQLRAAYSRDPSIFFDFVVEDLP